MTLTVAELLATPGVEQVFCFENRGEEIGVTLTHPHGQIYGYPYLTPRTAIMLHQARQHRETHDSNLFTDLLAAEVADGDRVVARSDTFTAFVPFAAVPCVVSGAGSSRSRFWPTELAFDNRLSLPGAKRCCPCEAGKGEPVGMSCRSSFSLVTSQSSC